MKDIDFPGKYIATKLVMQGDQETVQDTYKIARDVILGKKEHEYFPTDGDELEDFIFALGTRGYLEEQKDLERLLRAN